MQINHTNRCRDDNLADIDEARLCTSNRALTWRATEKIYTLSIG